MGDICQNANVNIYNYELFYNGNKISLDSSFGEIINKEDKNANIMKIKLNYKIYDIDEDNDKDKINNIKSKDIICPLFGESIFMNIKDYKINLYDCKNKHRINNLLLSEFEKTQNIDLSKIICNICKGKIKDKANNNLFFRCLTCGINYCPQCKMKINKNHKIVNYDEKDYICDKHNEVYKYYCSQCKLNICILCFSEHIIHIHNIISFEPYNKQELLNEIIEIKKKFSNLNKSINEIIDKFHNCIYTVNMYNEM